MRPLLKYGVPLAAGLATGGYALSQGEDPGSAALAGIAGAAGGAGGLLGARLAGKYMAPHLAEGAAGFTSVLGPVMAKLQKGKEGGLRREIAENIPKGVEKLGNYLYSDSYPRHIQKGIAAGAVPASALAAGLGGVALGAIPGSMGVPGFVQGGPLDPEAYGSSNSPGAQYKTPTMQYV